MLICLKDIQRKSFYMFFLRKCQLEAATRGVMQKKMFLEISQENTCAKVSFLINLTFLIQLLKKRLWHSCFPTNFAKFLRTRFSQNTSGRLLLCQPKVPLSTRSALGGHSGTWELGHLEGNRRTLEVHSSTPALKALKYLGA